MGIPQTNKLLRQCALSEVQRLKNQKLVLDFSKPQWFINRFLKMSHFDRHQDDVSRFRLLGSHSYGGNLVELDRFLRNFFNMLKQAHINPIIVYEGINPSESESVPGSKVVYLEKSSASSLVVNSRVQPRNYTTLPELTVTLIKRISHELGMDAEVVQCAHEVYPMLCHLSTLHDCHVVTNHADFIMMNSRKGFVQWEHVRTQLNSENEMVVDVSMHRKLLERFSITNTGNSLCTLLTLMRADFQGLYPRELNELLQLKHPLVYNNGRFIPYSSGFRQGNEFGRLYEVMEKWNSLKFYTDTDVRNALVAIARGTKNQTVIRDFDVIHRTFSEPLTLDSLIPASVRSYNVLEALVRRESSAGFVVNVMCKRKIFNRIVVEDCETILSSFSLANAARELLMVEASVGELHLFDRVKAEMQWQKIEQSLDPNSLKQVPGDQLLFGHIFRFPAQLADESHLEQWIEARKRGSGFASGRALELESCKQLVVTLLLARYAFEFAFRRRSRLATTMPRERLDQSRSLSSSGSDRAGQEVADSRSSLYQGKRIQYCKALYNCFMHYHGAGVAHLPDAAPDPRVKQRHTLTDQLLLDSQFFPNLHLLSKTLAMPKVQEVELPLRDKHYLARKHCNELMNATLHAYCELNSLLSYPATKLQFNRWFDAQLVYKIMRYDERSGESLMSLDKDLVDLINTPF